MARRKLTEAMIKEIRDIYMNRTIYKWGLYKYAEIYGVEVTTMTKIISGMHYKDHDYKYKSWNQIKKERDAPKPNPRVWSDKYTSSRKRSSYKEYK